MRRGPRRGQVSRRWYRAPRLNARYRQYALFFGCAAIIAVGAFLMGRRKAPGDVLSAVPRGAWLLATVDVDALRPSPIARSLVGDDGLVIPGLGRLADACGFEPLAHLTQVALVAPEGDGEFGVAFAGDFDQRVLSECATKIFRARGGEPRTETHGSYTLVGAPPEAGPVAGPERSRHARLAYRAGGPFLVGRGEWLLTMIDAVDGKVARAAPELYALRSELAKPTSGGTPALVVAALLPKATRDRLKAEIEGQTSATGGAYAGVLAIDRAAVAVVTGAPGSTTHVAAEVHCETADACAAVKTLVEKKRLEASGSPLRLFGLGQALDSLAVDVNGPTLSARADAPTDVLARLASHLATLGR
jgi:hypothetical protein